MQGQGKTVNAILGLLFLGAIVWLVYTLARSLWIGLMGLNSDLAVAIVAASLTGLVSVITLIVSKRQESQSLVQQQIREKKIPIYEQLISFLINAILADKIGKEKMSEQEMVKKFAEFVEELIIWGSDGVLLRYEQFRNATNRGVSPAELMFIFEALLLEIRKDLGHSNKSLSQGKLLGLFINDVEKHLPKLNTTKSTPKN